MKKWNSFCHRDKITEEQQWDDQREVMYNAWKATKIFLTPMKTVFDDNVVLSVNYNGVYYEQRFYYKDVYGSGDATTVAFSRLQSELNRINKNIELKWPPKDYNFSFDTK